MAARKRLGNPTLRKTAKVVDETAVAEATSPWDLSPDAEGLTLLMRRFVDCYVGDARGNATQAAKLAGYSPAGAAAYGSKLLQDTRVSDAITRRLRYAVNSASPEEVLSFWSDAMRGNVVDTVVTQKGDVVEAPIDSRGRLKASELLAKYLGLNAPTKIDVEVRDNRADLANAMTAIVERARRAGKLDDGNE